MILGAIITNLYLKMSLHRLLQHAWIEISFSNGYIRVFILLIYL